MNYIIECLCDGALSKQNNVYFLTDLTITELLYFLWSRFHFFKCISLTREGIQLKDFDYFAVLKELSNERHGRYDSSPDFVFFLWFLHQIRGEGSNYFGHSCVHSISVQFPWLVWTIIVFQNCFLKYFIVLTCFLMSLCLSCHPHSVVLHMNHICIHYSHSSLLLPTGESKIRVYMLNSGGKKLYIKVRVLPCCTTVSE